MEAVFQDDPETGLDRNNAEEDDDDEDLLQDQMDKYADVPYITGTNVDCGIIHLINNILNIELVIWRATNEFF